MKKLILLLALVSPIFAALPDYTTVWELENAGSNSNGGCFATGSSGTDHSQQSSAFTAFTDLVVGGTTSQATSVAHPFSSTDVGNCIKIVSGTNCTVGWYYVVSVTSVIATLDRALGTAASVCIANEGGALGTWSQMTTNMVLSIAGSGWVKADSTYSVAATFQMGFNTNVGRPTITGYTSTRGDNGMPLFQAAAGLGGADNYVITFNGQFGAVLANFTLDCNNLGNTGGISFTGSYETAVNISVKNCTDSAFNMGLGTVCIRCTSLNSPSASAANRGVTVTTNMVDNTCVDCSFLGSTVAGAVGVQSRQGTWINTIVAHYTGAASIAFQGANPQEGTQLTILNATVYDIAGDAFQMGQSQDTDARPRQIRNAVISNITGWCFSTNSTTLTLTPQLFASDHNACNVTGATGFYSGWPAGPGDVTLTSDPFVSGSSNNFALNGTAGASVKGAGYPGVLPLGGTGFIDMGALQSQGGSSGTTGRPIL